MNEKEKKGEDMKSRTRFIRNRFPWFGRTMLFFI